VTAAGQRQLAYLDTSAYVKLVLEEPEHLALAQALRGCAGRISSVLLRVEAERACGRYGESWAARARAGLGGVSFLPIDEAIVRAAATVRPSELRSLDAIHLATALSVGPRRCVLFSYDDRLSTAAEAAGVPVERPA
jgi:uncharacterized protein